MSNAHDYTRALLAGLTNEQLEAVWGQVEGEVRSRAWPAMTARQGEADEWGAFFMTCPHCQAERDANNVYAVEMGERWTSNGTLEEGEVPFRLEGCGDYEATAVYRCQVCTHLVSLPAGWNERID